MVGKHNFFFVVGMHRSGTSCLAGTLETCGVFLGDVRRKGRFNAKGYFEREDVQHIHDQILALNRAAWHSPRQQIKVHPYHQQALAKIAGQLSCHLPCAIKDPRLLLLLDTWFDIATQPHTLVGTFRHPLAVAQSLARRNHLSEKKAVNLWLHYNRKLVHRHKTSSFPLVEYDLSDGEKYCSSVVKLAEQLGLSPTFRKIKRFVSPKLEHHSFSGVPVPPDCQETFEYLRQQVVR